MLARVGPARPSAPTDALREVGGFDTELRRAEDVELGHRLHLSGLSFVFEPEARAFHYAERSFESWCRIAFDYGRNDVRFAKRGHVESLRFIRGFYLQRNPVQRLLVRVLLARPSLEPITSWLLERLAFGATKLGLPSLGGLFLSALYNARYYRGVADELGGPGEFRKLVRGASPVDRLVAWVVLEQTLGHITHGKNLQSLLPQVDGFEPSFLPISDALDGPGRHVPGWSNWTVRAGLRARRALARCRRSGWRPRADVLFVHSQVPAMLLGRWMRRIPTVVSLDATPVQYDELGEHYAHRVGPAWVEQLKAALHRRCFSRAAWLITWSEWAKRGLVEQYGVAADGVEVIAPGVDVELWSRPAGDAAPCEGLRVLFVGGDLRRKGGDLLLEAVRRLRSEDGMVPFELHVVTTTELEDEPGVVVHRGLTANSPELIEQYRRADVFCLPTQGDCLPMVLAEAGAAGLALVSTDVGAISEIVRDRETGRLVAPGDLDGLVDALRELLTDDELRSRCARQARALVESDHDARRNAERIVAVLRRAAGDKRQALNLH